MLQVMFLDCGGVPLGTGSTACRELHVFTSFFDQVGVCVRTCRTAARRLSQETEDGRKIKRRRRRGGDSSLLLERGGRGRCSLNWLSELDLSRVGGEQQHDGEARQQAGVLDGKSDEESAATGVLFLTTHLVHLR